MIGLEILTRDGLATAQAVRRASKINPRARTYRAKRAQISLPLE